MPIFSLGKPSCRKRRQETKGLEVWFNVVFKGARESTQAVSAWSGWHLRKEGVLLVPEVGGPSLWSPSQQYVWLCILEASQFLSGR